MAKTASIEISVYEDPQVKELKAQLDAAHAEEKASGEEWDDIGRVLNPSPSSSTNTAFVSELDVLKARQQEPIARQRFLEARAVVLELKPIYERARDEALRRLTEARTRGRSPLLRQFADALDAAKAIGETIRAFDEETVRLGGRAAEHPLPWLIDELPWRSGEASRIRREVTLLEGK